jgi:hypothetical protein
MGQHFGCQFRKKDKIFINSTVYANSTTGKTDGDPKTEEY